MVDPTINEEMMEMYADQESRGGILEPPGICEVKFRKADQIKTMHRLDEELMEMDQINPEFPATDVVLVLGANDVVNPQAKSDPNSPLYGMPVLDVQEARTVFVVKRGMSAGYSGIKNDLFELVNTSMLFGDAKKVLGDLLVELKDLGLGKK